MKFIYISILLLSNLAFSISEDKKLNACFITINSDLEKKEFKKALSSGPNRGKFNFHEFIPEGKGLGWLDKACKENIRCDILLISGHFAGSFSGNSGKSLKIEELEKHSCNNSCDGLLSSPKEVFLMGCNTLAGKDRDNRSSETYLQVLLEHGYDLEEAQQIVETRYGAIGTSFSSTMKRTFKGVPHIYGFHSIGPSGANVQFLLRDYLGKVKDYYGHIMRIEMERTLALKGKFNEWNKRNKKISESLKSTNFSQTSGLLVGHCRGGEALNTHESNYGLMKNLCELIDDTISEEKKAELIFDLLKRDDFDLYVKHIQIEIKSNNKLNRLFMAKVNSDNKLKENLKSLLEKATTRAAKLSMGELLLDLEIIDENEMQNIEKKLVLAYLRHPVTIQSKDELCSIAEGMKRTELKLEDLDPKILSDEYGLMAIGCLEKVNDNLVQKLFSILKSSTNRDAQADIYNIIGKSGTEDEKIISYLHKMANSKDFFNKVLALRALYFLNQTTTDEYKTIVSLYTSNKSIRVHGEHLNMRSIFLNRPPPPGMTL